MDRVVYRHECRSSGPPGRSTHKSPPARLCLSAAETCATQPRRTAVPNAMTPAGGNESGSWRRHGPLPGTRRVPALRLGQKTRRCAHRSFQLLPAEFGSAPGPQLTARMEIRPRLSAVFMANIPPEDGDTLSLRRISLAKRDFAAKKSHQCRFGRGTSEHSQNGNVSHKLAQ